MSAIVKSSESRVAKASKGIHPYKGTTITQSFLRQQLKSWQQHLERISPFLVSGEDVWWESIEGGYLFRDSDNDVENHSEGVTKRQIPGKWWLHRGFNFLLPKYSSIPVKEVLMMKLNTHCTQEEMGK